MAGDPFYYLGKILKTYGNKGHLLVHLDVDDPEDYLDLKSVYLDLDGERIPFFIEEVELKHNHKAIFRFQDVFSIEEAEIYPGRKIFLPLEELPELEGNRFYYHEVTGYSMIDKKHGLIGTISGILDLPHQSLFQVVQGKHEILIPVVDEIIKQVDRENKTIFIEAPEGLIEIYL
jgi:16S rRNA processing protein RimM